MNTPSHFMQKTCARRGRVPGKAFNRPQVLALMVLLLLMVVSSSAFGATTTGFCNFSTSRQNLWGNGSAYSYQKNLTLFEVPLDVDTKKLTNDFRPVVTILGDDYGADIGAVSTGKIGMYFNLDATAGEIDVRYGGAVNFEYPDRRTFVKGATFTVKTSIDERLKHIVTRSPRVVTDLYLAGYITLDAYYKFLLKSNEYPVFNLSFDSRDYSDPANPYYTINGNTGNMGFSLFKLDSGSSTVEPYVKVFYPDKYNLLNGGYITQGLPFPVPDNITEKTNISGEFNLPHLELDDDFLKDTADPKLLKASGEDIFIELSMDLDAWLPIPKPYELLIRGEYKNDFMGVEYGASYDILNVELGFNVSEVQDFEFRPVVSASLAFSSPLGVCVTEASVAPPVLTDPCWKTNQTGVTMAVGQNLHINYPAGAPDKVTVTPSYALGQTNFRNKTSLHFEEPLTFEFLKAEAHIDGFEIVPRLCIPAVTAWACWPFDCGDVTITPEICTPSIGFDGLKYELGPVWDYTLSSGLQNQYLPVYDKSWSLGGFSPAAIADATSVFDMESGEPPTAYDGTMSLTEDQPKQGTLTASPVRDNKQTFRVISQGAKGTVTITNTVTGAYTYTPNPDAYGSDTFTFKVHDNNPLMDVDSNLGTITVTIANLNDTPRDILLSKDHVAQASASGTVVATLTAVDPDLPDHDSHTFNLTDSAGGRFKIVGNQLQVDNGGLLNYSTAIQHNVTIKVTDASGTFFSKTLTIKVKSIPVANAGTLAVTEDFARTGSLAATDQDGEVQAYSIVTPPAKGSVIITNATTGAYTYTPLRHLNGADSFTFRSTDASGYQSNVAAIAVTTTAVNDPILDMIINPAVSTAKSFDTSKSFGETEAFFERSSGEYIAYLKRYMSASPDIAIYKREADGSLTSQTIASPPSYASDFSISGDYAVFVLNLEVKIYKRSSSDGIWRQETTLTLPAGASYVKCAAISGDTIVASDSLKGIYFYQRNSSSGAWEWKQTVAKGSEDTNYLFGPSIAISGNVAAVGLKAVGTQQTRINNKLYIFEKDTNGAWSKTAELQSGYTAATDGFGYKLALNGPVAVVGVPSDSEKGPNAGAAYLFERFDDGSWRSARLTATDGQAGDLFGTAVSVRDNTIAIGAPGKSVMGKIGAVYIFNRNAEGYFAETGKVVRPITQYPMTRFGYLVSLMDKYDDIVVAGDHQQHSYKTVLMTRTGSAPAISVNEGLNHGGGTGVVLGGSATGTVVGSVVPVSPDLDMPDLLSTFTFTLTDNAGGRFKMAGNQIQVDNADLLDFESAKSHNIRVRAVDSHGSSFEKYFRIYVNNLNEIPRADDKSFTTQEDTPLTGILTGSDVAGDTLNFKIAASPKKGTVSLNSATGAFTYTPNSNITGTDTFTYKVNDGLLDSLAATVTVQITPVNDKPSDISTLAGAAVLSDALGAAGDHYGSSVAVYGIFAVIGASHNSENASNSGAAVFLEKGTDGLWRQSQKVKPGSQADEFTGAAVAISGTYAVIGAYGHDRTGAADSGMAHIYKLSNGTWSYDAAFDPAVSQANDRTGLSVGISGSYAIAGAPGVAANGSNAGAVYIMEHGASVWNAPARLLPADGAAGDLFGTAVSISGSYAIVGAPGDTDKGAYSGSAYIFERNPVSGIWEQKAKLLASDGVAGDLFGTAVAISGSDAVVGANYHAAYGMEKSGTAYVFRRAADGVWSQTGKLTAPDVAPGDELGTAVSISGDLVAAGAPKNGGKGSLHLFQRGGDGKWAHFQKITANDGAAGDGLGTAVSISGNNLLAGASLADVSGRADAGKAYLFVAGNFTVQENAPVNAVVGQLTVSNADAGDTFTYTLVNDAGGRFKLNGSQILVANGNLIDYEIATSHDISVRVTDSAGSSIDKAITISVISINEAPMAQNDTIFTYRDVAKEGMLPASDAEGGTQTFSIVTNAANGTAVLLDSATGAYRYTPGPGFTGIDTFSYTASDGSQNSEVATITVRVVNNANDGLLAYYPFSGNADDASGNNRNGTVTGAVLTADKFGIASNAFGFYPAYMGSAKYISLPSFSIGGAFSVAAWVKTDGLFREGQRLIDFGDGAGINNIFVGWNSGKMIANVYNGASGQAVSSTEKFPTFQWVHVAVSVDASGHLDMYWNGLLKGSGTTNVPPLLARSKQYLGTSNWTGDFPFYGEMDEIRLYNRALSSADVAAIYSVPSCGASDRGIFTAMPTANLCTSGTASAIAGSGPWNWSCNVPSGSASCTAYRKVDGTCSAANGMSLDAVPATLCASGTASAVAGTGPWNWTCNGAYTGATASCSASINTYPLTVLKTGAGTGLISASVGTLNWSADTGSATYNSGTTVTLTAIPTQNSTFAGWSGACSGTAACTVSMSAARDVSAAFVNKNAGLLAYFPFNGSADDASGNGRHATVSGSSLTADLSGIPDYAYGFNGSGNYIAIPSFPIGGEFSVSAWVYLNDNAVNWQRLIDFGNGSWDNNLVVGWVNQKMFVESYNGSASQKVYSTENFPQGQWVHVAAAIDAAGITTIYWNGEVKGTGRTIVPPTLSRSNQYLGRSNWPDPYFGGKIDEVRLYSRALTDSDVKALYQVNGTCGSSHEANVTSVPTTGMCQEGTASAVTGSGPWAWSCSGDHGGGSASCGANLKVDGACGTSNGQTLTTIAGANLCSAGTASAVTGSGPWSWTCQGINAGADAGCSAAIQTYPVTITKSGTGTGTIIDNSGGLITWNGSTGSGYIKHGTNLVLNAVLDPGSIVKSWMDILDDSESYSVTVDSAKNIAVEFTTAGLNDGLLINWLFDGNANDTSGNGYNGVVTGASLASDQFGVSSKAYSFPGGLSNITIAPTAALPTVNNLSISMWFRTDNSIDYYWEPYLISKGRIEHVGQIISQPQFAIGLPAAGQYDIESGGQRLRVNGSFANNEWTHMAVVYRGTTATVYENGVQIGQGTVAAVHELGNFFSDRSDLFVGMGGQDPFYNPRWDNFKGSIDEVRIYNRALTATEVDQLRLVNINTLTINKSTTGSGAVTSSTGSIKWNGTTGKAYFGKTNNTVVTLTATPDSGAVFTGWSGACSGTGTCTVTMDVSRDVTATFMSPTDGLIAYYQFNGNANDSGGSGYNGTVFGATATTDRFGNASSALNFDGSGNYISLPPFPIAGPFSLSAWVYLNSNSTNMQRIIDFGNGEYNNNLVVGISSPNMFMEAYSNSSTNKVYTAEAFPQGQWVHVAATIDGGGNAKIYWNGVLKGSGWTYLPPSLSRTYQYIGRSNWNDPYFGGKMDDLRLYNRALDPQEAVLLSTHPLTVTKSGSGTGTVTSDKGTLQWSGNTATAIIHSSEVVTLTATPDGSATFTGWTGACSGTGSCVITMDAAKTVGAIFTHDITAPTGSISVNSGSANTSTESVTLTLSCSDTDTGCSQMRFSNDNVTWSAPETFAATRAWSITPAPTMTTVPLLISNFQPDFQTRLTVPYDSAMRSDFADLRFYDANTLANIPYWIEGKADGVSATVWIKTGACNSVMMGYGMPEAASTSSQESVFELYDDFNVFDSSKWKIVNPANAFWSQYLWGDKYTIYAQYGAGYKYGAINSTDDNAPYVLSKNPLPEKYIVEAHLGVNTYGPTRFFALRSSDATNAKTFFMTTDTAWDNSCYLTSGYRDTENGYANWYGENSGVYVGTSCHSNGGELWAGFKFVVNGDTVSSYVNGTLMQTRTVPGWNLRHIALLNNSLQNYVERTTYNMISVRKYADVEPVVTIGTQKVLRPYDVTQTRNVYVKFMDNAGNWSAPYSDTIQLDSAGPALMAFPSGGNYNTAQNVTLICNDGGGIGCSGPVYYTTDGTTPTSSSTPYSDPIAISSHTVLKFMAADALGNSTARTEVYDFNLLGGAIQNGSLTVEPAVVTTLAGLAGAAGTVDAAGAAARFNGPVGITSDGVNLYATGHGDHTVRKIVIATGQVSTLAGQANTPGSGDGIGTAASFRNPWGITTDGANLYVADSTNHTIRKIVIDTGEVTTLAGLAGNSGTADGSGTSARFSQPRGLTADGANLYVADTGNHTLRKIDIASGVVSTIAGTAGSPGAIDNTGAAARFNGPGGITTDSTNLYVSDTNSQTIRKVVMSTAAVTTLAGAAGSAGSVDGTATAARFYYPGGIVTDGVHLYVADQWGQAIRKIEIATGSVLTIAGALGTGGAADGTGWDARFNNPCTITSDGAGLYVADYGNHAIRKIAAGSDTRSSGLIAHYPFSGNANDASGNNRNGTVFGTALTADRFGNANSAYSFDGVGNYMALPPFQIGGDFSLSAWVYLNSNTTAWQRVIDFGNGQASNNLVVGIDNNRKMFVVGDTAPTVSTSEDFPTGQWVHIAATLDGSGNAKIYWNGVLKLAGTTTPVVSLTRSNQYIGRSNWAVDAYFGGRMDDLRLYGKALSLSEIEALYTYEKGSCGSAGNQILAAVPTANLCSTGVASAVTVNGGALAWSCSGINGGAGASCGANLIINGSCGASSGQPFDQKPATALCGAGSASDVTGSGPWNWTCSGYNGGTSADCTANINSYTVTVSKTGTGAAGGLVSASSGPLNWNGNNGSAGYDYGTMVTLTATSSTGSTFTGWSGACSGKGPCTVTVDGVKNLTASFYDLASGLLAYYPLHGDANDVSGNSRHAAVTGATAVANSENDGILAYEFNPWNNYNPKYLTVPPFEFGGAFSVAAWVSLPLYDCNNIYYACGSNNERIIDFGTGQSDNIIVSVVRGKLHAEVRIGANNGVGITSGEDFPDLARTHVAVTIDAGGFMRMYWNGVLKASGQAAVPRTVTRANQYVGKSNWVEDPYLQGKMDDLRLYNRALADSDIAELYASRDALCGSSDRQRLTSQPTAGFCSRGTASAVSGGAPWTWTCYGDRAGLDATCSAAHADTQTITFNPATVAYGSPSIDLSTYASGGASGNPVTFSLVSGPGMLGGLNNATLTVTGTGNVVVKASQAGNSDYLDAADVQQTITVVKAAATVTLGNLSQAYDGIAKPVTVTTIPANRNVTVTYNGSATAPTAVGSYNVVATVVEDSYQGTASGTLVVGKGNVAITLDGLSVIYDGSAKAVTAMTSPAGKTVTFTYDGSSTPPVNAGSYAVVATVNDSSYQGTASGTLVISKKPVLITLGNLSQTYDGTARTISVNSIPSGRPMTVTYNGSATAPTAAGSHAVVATVVDDNYVGSASGTLVIAKAAATLSLGSLSATYDGTAKPVTFTVTPSGKTVVVTYNDSPSAPVAAGTYSVIATVDDPNYAGIVYGTLIIGKQTATVTVSNLSHTYDGIAKTATAVTSPEGLPVTVAYRGSAMAPVNAGSYAVTATISDTNYGGTAGGTMVIAKATASISLGNLLVSYDGSQKTATAITDPPGKIVTLTYNGLSTAPTAIGSYAVVATIDDVNYQGTASGILEITGMPLIKSFSAVPRLNYLLADITAFTASDNTAITGYCVTEANVSSGCTWNGTAPASYTFATAGQKTLYAFVRDADGNISAPYGPVAMAVSSPSLTVIIATNGTLTSGIGGTVTSVPSGLSCTNTVKGTVAECVKSMSGTVNLYATPSILSRFGGWGGAVCSGTGSCTVTMDADKSVTATFNQAALLHIGGTEYATLQAAYDAAGTASVIQLLATDTGTLTANRNVSVTLKGGYDATYGSATGVTGIGKPMTIELGTIIVDGIAIK